MKLRYQPLVSARDGHVVGMEALLRWQSPTLGMLVPERFMRTAERLGIIVQIGTWVLEGALKQARLWRDQGFDDFTIAVNVSTLQLLRPNFFAEVMSPAGRRRAGTHADAGDQRKRADQQRQFRP